MRQPNVKYFSLIFPKEANGVTVLIVGGVRFRLAALCDDMGLLNAAFQRARELIATDSDLSAHPHLRETVNAMFTLNADTIS